MGSKLGLASVNKTVPLYNTGLESTMLRWDTVPVDPHWCPTFPVSVPLYLREGRLRYSLLSHYMWGYASSANAQQKPGGTIGWKKSGTLKMSCKHATSEKPESVPLYLNLPYIVISAYTTSTAQMHSKLVRYRPTRNSAKADFCAFSTSKKSSVAVCETVLVSINH